MTTPSTTTHDSHYCLCPMCLWSNEAEQRSQQSLEQQRCAVLAELRQLERRLSEIDDQIDAMEKRYGN